MRPNKWLDYMKPVNFGPKARCPGCGGLFFSNAMKGGICVRCQIEAAREREKAAAIATEGKAAQ